MLVVGIIIISPGRVSPSLSFPSVDRSIAYDSFTKPVVSASLNHTAPSQPLDARRDDAIEAFFDPEEDEDQGFNETLVAYENVSSLDSPDFLAPCLMAGCISPNRLIHSDRSRLLRC